MSIYRPIRVRWLIPMLLALGLVLSACKTGKGKRDADDLEREPPITAQSEEAQRQFDQAKALLVEGRYDEAREAFRLLQAEYSSDPIAEVAELYLGRTLLGDIPLNRAADDEQTDDTRSWRKAAQLLAPLAESDSVDRRIRYGAKAYYGLALAVGGSTDDALASLADYPGSSLSDVVLDRDRPAVRGLLIESFYRAARYAEVMETAAKLHAELAAAARDRAEEERRDGELGGPRDPAEEVTREPGEAGAVAQDDGDSGLESVVALAKQRAFDASREDIDEVDLQDYLGADLPLLRAAAGWGVLSGRLDEGFEESARPALEDLFNRIAPDLVEVGAAERAAELSMRLAAAGGPKRLAIGFLLPLTGSHKAIGQRAMAGALVAMRSFHDVGHPEVTLVFQDSHADPTAAFEALVEQDVLAVVGPLDVRRARKYAPIAEQHEIPMLTLTTASASERPKKRAKETVEGEEQEPSAPFVFRNFIDAAAEARASARIAFDEIGDRKAAIVYPDVGYGEVTSAAFADEFRALGGRIVAEIPYDRSRSDFGRVAKKLAQAKPEAVFLPDSAEKVAELTAFFAQENIWGLAPDKKPPARARRTLVHYLGTSLWEHPILIRQSASYVEGAAIPVWFSAAVPDGRVRQFVDRFEAIYGRKPENFEAFSYDSVNWLRSLLLERGMRRPEAIRDALLAGDQHHGVTGRVQMTREGEPARAIRFVTPTSEGFEALPFTAAAVVRAENDEDAEPEGAEDPDDPQGAASDDASDDEARRR